MILTRGFDEMIIQITNYDKEAKSFFETLEGQL
jgi:hypothetical protein